MKKKEALEAKLQDKCEELEHQLKRALADYANLQKRTEEEKKNLAKFSNAVLISKLLEVVDGLEAAQKAHPSDGLDLITKKFKDILASEGVEEIATDSDFNPELHEGIAMVPGEKNGEIAEVVQKGYAIEGRIIRPARVKVTQTQGEG